MPTFQCFFAAPAGTVDHFIVVEARDDARACVLASKHLEDHASFTSVEIFEGERLVGRFERAGA